jgi:tRNA (cmo5U34)-methyltransferase
VRDTIVPTEAWTFDSEVAKSFDDMLSRSIPDYEPMRLAVSRLAAEIVSGRSEPEILDLGSSRGETIARLGDGPLGNRARFTAVETAPAMLEVLRDRFEDEENVDVLDLDLRENYPAGRFDLVLAVLTIQFVPVEHRPRLLAEIRSSLDEDGGFLLVEKVIGPSRRIDDLLVAAYYGLKADNGYSFEQIQTKRRSLENVLVPLTAAANEQLIAAAGFSEIEQIWRWGNFVGWLALP